MRISDWSSDVCSSDLSKFSMGTVLGLIALRGRAGLPEFDAALGDPVVAQFCDRVSMELDTEVDTAYPAQWIGKVMVRTQDGRNFSARVDEPKGDTGNTLSREELEDKALRLGTFRNAARAGGVQPLIQRIDS